jgi:hypothetical protein
MFGLLCFMAMGVIIGLFAQLCALGKPKKNYRPKAGSTSEKLFQTEE